MSIPLTFIYGNFCTPDAYAADSDHASGEDVKSAKKRRLSGSTAKAGARSHHTAKPGPAQEQSAVDQPDSAPARASGADKAQDEDAEMQDAGPAPASTKATGKQPDSSAKTPKATKGASKTPKKGKTGDDGDEAMDMEDIDVSDADPNTFAGLIPGCDITVENQVGIGAINHVTQYLQWQVQVAPIGATSLFFEWTSSEARVVISVGRHLCCPPVC